MKHKRIYWLTGIVLAGLLASVPASATLWAQRQDESSFNRTWRFKHAHSAGKASLGGIVNITLRPNRLVIVRPNANGDRVAWSCPTNGTTCQNDPQDGSPSTASVVTAERDRLIIVTRGADAAGAAVEVRRILHINNRNELVVETSSSGDNRFHGRSIYRAYKVQ